MSRHLYDLERLMDTKFAADALRDDELYEAIIRHRAKFYQEMIVSELCQQSRAITETLNVYGKHVIDSIQHGNNIESSTVLLSVVQESQQILNCLRHMLEGYEKFIN